ncbi:hypothetical protein ANCCAN_12172 [Ancylostoma caninum]|uniref:Immunoglobulin I-set domain protein n=1 Tax=Ancylostoma caninum TaxID=29170 RepID=A0A368GF66_ANCCA|nr:hypothetical protein ANCCAN_12172 [Ancylostoma caninum]
MDAHSFPNGTLLIRHFSVIHNGVYECVVSNFAAKTSTRVVIDSKQASSRNGMVFSMSRQSINRFLATCRIFSIISQRQVFVAVQEQCAVVPRRMLSDELFCADLPPLRSGAYAATPTSHDGPVNVGPFEPAAWTGLPQSHRATA